MKKVSKLVQQRNAWRFLLPGNTTTTTTHRKRKKNPETTTKTNPEMKRKGYGYSYLGRNGYYLYREPIRISGVGLSIKFRANPNRPNYPIGFSNYKEYKKYAEIALDVYNKTHPIKYSLVDMKLVVGQNVMQQLNVVFTAKPNSDADVDNKIPITFRADVHVSQARP